MKTKRKLNIRLLRKIQKHILEEPRRFFMTGIVHTGAPGKTFSEVSRMLFDDLPLRVPPCGTTACIHGWTALFHDKTVKQTGHLSFQWSAKKIGLPPRKTESLFVAESWPKPFADQYTQARIPMRRAKIAAARIEHLIKTGE